MNNRPITARVKSGMFKTKEPLLNVGPAGVDGNNQTRSMPSPSKMKGYAMKSSPFKQKVVYEVNKDGKLTAKKTTTETTPAVPGTNGTPGQAAQDAIYDTGKGLSGLTQKQLDWREAKIKELGGIDNYHIEYGDPTAGTKVKDAVPAVADTPATDGKDEETKVFEQKADPMRKVEGEASTAFASRNNLRKGVQANRKVKKYEIKNARSKKKGGGYYSNVLDDKLKATGERELTTDSMNDSSREIKKEGRIAKRDQAKKDRKERKGLKGKEKRVQAREQRKARNKKMDSVRAEAKETKRDNKKEFKEEKSEAKAKQTERNYQIAKQEAAGALEQSTQRKTGFSQNKTIRTTDVRETGGDVTDDNKLLDGAPKVDVTPKKENTDNPQGATMKSSGFFKKKSPMKMNYFKK
mgnify:CR=1 FL=1|tara:strand:- start:226 stop:1449 length:1224 start_codon:yes stop_codon:yes gene_type:complete